MNKIQLRAIHEQYKGDVLSTQVLFNKQPMCIIDIRPSTLILFLADLLKALGCENAQVEMYKESK